MVIYSETVKWWNSSIWPKDGTLTGTTSLGQDGPGSNGNEGILPILQSSRIVTLPSNDIASYSRYSMGGVLPLYGDAISVILQPQSTGLCNSGFQLLGPAFTLLYQDQNFIRIRYHKFTLQGPEIYSLYHLSMTVRFFSRNDKLFNSYFVCSHRKYTIKDLVSVYFWCLV